MYESLMDDYDWINETICGLNAGWAIAFGAELINDMEIAKKNTYIQSESRPARILGSANKRLEIIERDSSAIGRTHQHA